MPQTPISIVNNFTKRARNAVMTLPRLAHSFYRLDPAEVGVSLNRIQLKTKISSAFSRAAATAALRVIDAKRPISWEFSGFSQHGEDGIVDYLCSKLLTSNRFFFEIGAGNGVRNCTAWLAFARSYGGVWVEGDPGRCAQARMSIEETIWNVHVINRFVDPGSVPELLKMCPYREPDIFSLDIDSIDYHIAKKVLELGFRPKIWVVDVQFGIRS